MSVFHSQDVHLIDYLRVLYKRRVFVVVILLVALAFAAWTTQKTPKMYASRSQILLENEGTLVDFPGVRQYSLIRLDTEMLVMRSREVAEWAAAHLKPALDRRDPEFVNLTDTLMNSTSVETLRNTYIVELAARATDPEQARSWCAAMADGYVAVNLDAKKASNAAAARAIEEQIEQTKRDLEAAERRLMDFRIENNLVSDQSKATEQAQLYGAGTQAKAEASLKRIEYENKFRALQRWFQSNEDFSLPLPPDLAGTALVSDLYQQIVKKRIEHKSLLSKYRAQHPKVQAVVTELDTLQRNFNQEVHSALEVMRKQADVYGSIGQAHEAQGETEKREFLKKNERDWQYDVLERNVLAKQKIFESLLQKLGEINVLTSIVKNNARIIERPKLNPVAFQPNWRFNLLSALVFGTGVAIGGVFFLEYLDKTLKTPDDVARYLSLPVLAVVPLARQTALRAPYQAPQLREGETGATPA